MNVLALVNSASPGYREGVELVLPYLEHFGAPYVFLDINHTPLPENLGCYALILVTHRQMDPRLTRLGEVGRQKIVDAVRSGSGLISFDPLWFGDRRKTRLITAEKIVITDRHYVTERHAQGEEIRLGGELVAPRLEHEDARVLATVGGSPLVRAFGVGNGRLVEWATADWMKSGILGSLAGLDDLLWRGMVWAARKPFVLRGLPPLVTMRVDDVAGRGGVWEQSPLYWVKTANHFGLKPWLGLFIYNLTELAIQELRELLLAGAVTAFPHAFGRPPRPGTGDGYYYVKALPLRANDYDEFIFFDHHRGRAWSEIEARRGLEAVDEWYAAHAPLSISRYAVAHWYELGANTARHIRERWGADLIAKAQDFDQPLAGRIPWWIGRPFRQYEKPGACFPFAGRLGDRPVYYADFIHTVGQQFFNCLTEIRDDAGYEWSPDNDVTATVGRGVRQLRRALDSMALPVLFTHETDYIHKIHPDNWEKELLGITSALAGYNPRYVTMEQGIQVVRATRTARLVTCEWYPGNRRGKACLQGSADVPTLFYLFSGEDEDIESRMVEIPPFEGEIVVEFDLKGSYRDY